MQDRFSFRVWDKFCETWLTDFAINQDGEINKFFNSEEALKRRFVLMQSTGLKDKNGKLIYEGDILIQKEENEGPTKKLVIWEEDGGYLGLKDLKKSFFGVVTFHRFGYTYEVIGNIYENPELLEV